MLFILFTHSFQKFNIGFPTKKERPAPRQPIYLRDSYDLKNFRDDDCRDVITSTWQPRRPLSNRYDTISATDVLELSEDDMEENEYSAINKVCIRSKIFRKILSFFLNNDLV